jgi:NAD-dependent dihydropyrimidine dehydrogenase PreA subunit
MELSGSVNTVFHATHSTTSPPKQTYRNRHRPVPTQRRNCTITDLSVRRCPPSASPGPASTARAPAS